MPYRTCVPQLWWETRPEGSKKNDCPSIFSYVCWTFVCLLWRNVYLGLLSIFWLGYLILSCMSCLYNIFWKLSPCQSRHSQISSPSPYAIFLFYWGFLCSTKAYRFYWVPFVYFCFYFCCLGRLNGTSYVTECFVHGILWCHVLHVECIFVWGCVLNFIDLHVDVQLSQHSRDCLFSITCSCLLCWRLTVGVWI